MKHFAAMCLLLTSGIALAGSEEKIKAQALAMTPQQFQSSITIKDDALDTLAELNTSNGFQVKRGLLKIVWNDNFLRAFIDNKTGKTTIQLYEFVMYEGDWRYYNRVNFETPSGPKSAQLTSIARNVVTCAGSRYGSGCTLSEHFAFDVDEELLRTIANGYQPGAEKMWKFKYGAQRAEDWQSGLLPAEAAGFIAALDAYRSSKGLPKSTQDIAAQPKTNSASGTPQEQMNSEFRRRAKEAIDRGDLKAAKEYLDMIKE